MGTVGRDSIIHRLKTISGGIKEVHQGVEEIVPKTRRCKDKTIFARAEESSRGLNPSTRSQNRTGSHKSALLAGQLDECSP